MFLPASTLSVPGYYHTPCYSDLHQTTPNYFHRTLGTCAPNTAACFWYSHSTCTGSPIPEPGEWGAVGVGSRHDLPLQGAAFLAFQLSGWQPEAAGWAPEARLPSSPAGSAEGSRGQAGPARRHAYFLPPACADANSGVHKTGLHQTDQPPSSPRHYPRHKSWQKAAAEASADSPNNSGHKGLFCLRRWHKSDAITPARLQLAPYLFI